MSGKGTPFGAFLDSTLDRIEEGIVLTAVGAYFARAHGVRRRRRVAAVLFSLMVSYTRARAEALGVECKVGIASRAVRVVILSIGLVFAQGRGAGRLPTAGAVGLRARRPWASSPLSSASSTCAALSAPPTAVTAAPRRGRSP